jgi:hypothetical protein
MEASDALAALCDQTHSLDRLDELVSDPRHVDSLPGGGYRAPWRPGSFAAGYAGVALFLAAYARAGAAPRAGAHAAARTHLQRALPFAQRGPGANALFGRVIGNALVAELLRKDDRELTGLMGQLEERAVSCAVEKLEVLGNIPELPFSSELRPESGLTPIFDMMAGLAGFWSFIDGRSGYEPLTSEIVDRFVKITLTRVSSDGTPCGWAMARPGEREFSINTGMSHGVVGPLNVMASALRAGCEDQRVRDAVRVLADWLFQAADVGARASFGGIVRVGDDGLTRGYAVGPDRGRWCYGWPSALLVLQRAYVALGDQARRSVVEDVAVRKSRNLLDDPKLCEDVGLCHGVAGAAWSVKRLGEESTGSAVVLNDAADRLTQLILEAADDGAPFVWKYRSDLIPVAPDRVNLLDGSSGVGVFLIALEDPATAGVLDRILGLGRQIVQI